jgi:DNA-binding NtrC family response regulator
LPDSGQERILLVDDERAIVDAATTGLTRAGYYVRGTQSPHEAIDLAIREPFDLLLADIMMPGLNGIELLRTVKHLYPDIAGVMITGYGSMESAIDALRAGATGFLLKPFTANELRMAVEDALAKSRVMKENVRLKALMPLYESSKAFYGEMSLDRLVNSVTEQLARSWTPSTSACFCRTNRRQASARSALRPRTRRMAWFRPSGAKCWTG